MSPEEARRLHPSYDALAEARERARQAAHDRMLTPSCSDCGRPRDWTPLGALLCGRCDRPTRRERLRTWLSTAVNR